MKISNSKVHHIPLAQAVQALTSVPNDLAIGTTGDIHLYHPTVRTERIVRHLEEMYTDEYLQALDYLVLNGDVFDRRLSLEAPDWTVIIHWVSKILRRCRKFDVELVVIEGTRSHDHYQSSLFEFLNNILFRKDEQPCKLRYISKLSITYFGDHPVLIVPDEVNHDASVTAKQIRNLLKSHGLEQVDFAFMHGMFRYQAPVETVTAHDIEFFHRIVKHRIVINHIHHPSSCGIVRAPGSPCRLRHNEEETKGHHALALRNDECVDWFIETADNVVFRKVMVKGLELDEIYKILDAFEYEEGSFIRLDFTRECPAYASLLQIKARYHFYKITEKFLDSDIEQLGSGEDLINQPTFEGRELTLDVINDHLKTVLTHKFQDDVGLLETLTVILEED